MIPHLLFGALLLAVPAVLALLLPVQCQARIQAWGRRGFWLWPSALGIAIGTFLLHGSRDPLRVDAISLLGWCISACALVLLALPPAQPKSAVLSVSSVRIAGALLSIVAAAVMGFGLGVLNY